jgi:hypothetical protein
MVFGPTAGLTAGDRALVVAPHPDDEMPGPAAPSPA